jgi:hypothetical protein
MVDRMQGMRGREVERMILPSTDSVLTGRSALKVMGKEDILSMAKDSVI